MSTVKVRKLKAMAATCDYNPHEARIAQAKLDALEPKTAKGVARAIATLLEQRGLTVQTVSHGSKAALRRDVEVRVIYRVRRKMDFSRAILNVEVTEYE